ncbi:30S ribosomal protein S17e [Candidatus Bathyarchaeota archaeon]|nr:30S ribosomal protein S17e [Candidatus Bathyarchaeota archaeon]
MGKVRTESVKRLAEALLSRYPNGFGEDFEANKAFLNSLGLKISKRMRNRIVGYITQLRQMSLQTSHQTAEEGGSITRP